MKIIKAKDCIPERRPDGRDVFTLANCDFENKIVKMFRVIIPQGTLEKEHMHTESTETFIFLKPGEIIIEDKTYLLGELDIVILDKNERHKIVAKKDMDLIGIKADINDKIVMEK